jgi:hypothetical protein
MAHTYNTKVWDISGEYEFDGYVTLLNPAIKVISVGVHNNITSLHFNVTENGGVYIHEFSSQIEGLNETDLNILVDAAIEQIFPQAVLRK